MAFSYTCRAGACPGSPPVSIIATRIPDVCNQSVAVSVSAEPTPRFRVPGSTGQYVDLPDQAVRIELRGDESGWPRFVLGLGYPDMHRRIYQYGTDSFPLVDTPVGMQSTKDLDSEHLLESGEHRSPGSRGEQNDLLFV